MKTSTKVLIILSLIVLIGWIIFGIIHVKNYNFYKEYYEKSISDTSYTKIIKQLDSIEYRIEERNNNIYLIKQQLLDETKKTMALDDSVSIELFYKLVSEN